MKVFGELEKAQVELLTADPTGAELVVGRVWYRTDENKFKMYDGSNVVTYDERKGHFVIPLLDIDFEAADVFYKAISAGETYTFSNLYNGTAKSVIIENLTAGTLSVNFPASVQWANGTAVTDIPANSTNVYTFLTLPGLQFASVIEGMS